MGKDILEKVWKKHLDAEFIDHDVEAALATMTHDAFVMNVPTGLGGRGLDEVRAFYRDQFVLSLPDDWTAELKRRIVAEDALVDELHHTFTHTTRMNWMLPDIAPTNRKIEIDIVAIVYFRGDKMCGERIYWDQASVLRQAGLLT